MCLSAIRLFYEVRVQRIERALRRLTRERGATTAWEIWESPSGHLPRGVDGSLLTGPKNAP